MTVQEIHSLVDRIFAGVFIVLFFVAVALLVWA